jgi:hypothetical protein
MYTIAAAAALSAGSTVDRLFLLTATVTRIERSLAMQI